MKTRIHVNQHRIKRNAKTGERAPVLTCKTYKDNRYGSTAEIVHPVAGVVARVVYRPDDPLPCGARVWIETENGVEVS